MRGRHPSPSVDEYWADQLGVTVERLGPPGVALVHEGRGGFEGYSGVLFFRRGETLIVSAPPDLARSIEASLSALSPDAVEDLQLLRSVVGIEPERVVGPVFQAFVTPGRFSPPSAAHPVRLEDARTVESHLRRACTEEEWEVSGLSGVRTPVAAVREGDMIVAAAGARERAPRVVDPCVLTHPGHRGRGLGREVVACVTATALDQGDLVVYQTLRSNRGAVAIARGLGFVEYATGVAFRLAPDRAEGSR